jgi:hypothetical protein
MLLVDLACGPVDVAAISDAQAIELRAEHVEPEAVQAALMALPASRPEALRLVSSLRALPTALTELMTLQQLEVVDAELGELRALEHLQLVGISRLTIPRDVVMPGIRRLITGWTQLDATADELQAMVPNARITTTASD